MLRKALEKDKTRRYASAADLGADMQRYLNDEPIMARPPSATYQLRKFARRHRRMMAAVAAVFAVLVAGVAISTSEADSGQPGRASGTERTRPAVQPRPGQYRNERVGGETAG